MGSPVAAEQGQDGSNDYTRTGSDSSPRPPQPPAPDPSKDRGVIPSIKSPAPDEDGLEELDVWVLTPLAALKILCRGVDTLVRLTGDLPPTPPVRSRPQSPERFEGSKAYPQFHQKENLTPQRSRSGDHEIDGIPFTKTPIGSPEAHMSEPIHDVGADAEPTYIQHAAIARKFYSKRPPPITTEEYLLRMHKYCPMSTAVYLATSLYINRMAVTERVIPVTPRNVHRLLLAGLRVAMKALEDLSWPHARFSKVGGVSEVELGRLEIAFCFLMNFELRVDAKMLQAEVDTLAQAASSAIQDSPVSFEMQIPSKGEKRKASSTLPTRPAMPPEVQATSRRGSKDGI
jgi:hypothetical protein